jgi:hypothetical protein
MGHPQPLPPAEGTEFKLGVLPTKPSAQPLVQSTDVPSPSPTAGPSRGGQVAMTDDSLAGDSAGSGSAPSALIALASSTLPQIPEYNSDEDYCWAGDEDGLDYGNDTKPKSHIAGYMPSLNHSQVVPSFSLASSPMGNCASSTTTTCISLLTSLLTAIWTVCKSLIWSICCVGGLGVTDTSATNHMLPDASAFISYKKVTDLSIHMGNNSLSPSLVVALPSSP